MTACGCENKILNNKLLHFLILIFSNINVRVCDILFPVILIPGKMHFMLHQLFVIRFERFLCGGKKCPLCDEPYHDVVMNESLAVTCGFEVWVFLSTGHSYPPCFLPSLIQLNMDWINTRMVRGHGISQIYWNTMLL